MLAAQISTAETRAVKADLGRTAIESHAADSSALRSQVDSLKRTISSMQTTKRDDDQRFRRTLQQQRPYDDVKNKETIRRLRSILRGKGKLVDRRGIAGVKRELAGLKDQNASITAMLAAVIDREQDRTSSRVRDDRGYDSRETGRGRRSPEPAPPQTGNDEADDDADIEAFINGAVFVGRSIVQLTEAMASKVGASVADAELETDPDALVDTLRSVRRTVDDCQARSRTVLEDVLKTAMNALEPDQLEKLDMIGDDVDLSPVGRKAARTRVLKARRGAGGLGKSSRINLRDL